MPNLQQEYIDRLVEQLEIDSVTAMILLDSYLDSQKWILNLIDLDIDYWTEVIVGNIEEINREKLEEYNNNKQEVIDWQNNYVIWEDR